MRVQEGFDANRTDLISNGIRNRAFTRVAVVRYTVAHKTFVFGPQQSRRRDLEAVRASRKVLRTEVLNLARVADDQSLGLARGTTECVVAHGALQTSAGVKAAFGASKLLTGIDGGRRECSRGGA